MNAPYPADISLTAANLATALQGKLPAGQSLQQGPHAFHADDRSWTETNCYLDLWIEILHFLGHDPLPACSGVLNSWSELGQWSMVKPHYQQLLDLYGIAVEEFNPWRPLAHHLVQFLSRGIGVTIEVDSFALPDTAATDYQTNHVKTSIFPLAVDLQAKTMDYLHNSGRHSLQGTDFDIIFGTGENFQAHPDNHVTLPYVETVRRVVEPDRDTFTQRALTNIQQALATRSELTPMADLCAHLEADFQWLTTAGQDNFHAWSFGTLRAAGYCAELSADIADYLIAHDVAVQSETSELFRKIAEDLKGVQFKAARAARGRSVDITPIASQLLQDWQTATAGFPSP